MTIEVHQLDFKVKEIMKARADHIEMMCGAFIREAGADSVLKYELVEQIECNPVEGVIQRITWRFRKRTNEPS